MSLGKFDAILIDEVAQSTELSAIVPIVQVAQVVARVGFAGRMKIHWIRNVHAPCVHWSSLTTSPSSRFSASLHLLCSAAVHA